jgi:7,8-dihydropterin-6-yl-methyl-4-(beta-D-ribofuranosyl)aminobenzene 5'-phosphate synthase
VADGHRILFDTATRPDTVLNNARELNSNLANFHDVILTHNHNHGDHTGGLITLRQSVREKNPAALAVTHVEEGIFLKRDRSSHGWERMDRVRAAY